MRIGIEAHFLGGMQSGNETYLRGLITSLARVDGANSYAVYVADRDVLDDPPVRAENIEYRYVGSSKIARITTTLPLELARNRVDVLQACYTAPLVVPSRLVLVMHDIVWATKPHLFPRLHGRQSELRSRPAVRKAARVVVASSAMKHEVMDYYGLPEDRLAVVPLGLSDHFEVRDRAHARRRVAEAHGVDGPYILNVGDLQPRKNLPRMIEAFAGLLREGRDLQLVIVGKKAWLFDDIFATIERLGVAERVVLPGYVTDDQLVDLYNAAELFAYPSIYEGFGLPPLEAMACGTPVVVSDEPTLRETVAGAAMLFDPHDVDSLGAALARGLDDAAWRETARAAGLARAAEMSWDACARRMLDVYAEAGAR